MYHAVPASGVLCVELLRHSAAQNMATSISPASSPSSSFSISEAVQNLSLLVGFLDWVKSSAPNSELCYRIRDIIRQVLDRVLNTPLTQQMDAGTVWDFGREMDFNLREFDEYANLDLLDTFDWICEPWGG